MAVCLGREIFFNSRQQKERFIYSFWNIRNDGMLVVEWKQKHYALYAEQGSEECKFSRLKQSLPEGILVGELPLSLDLFDLNKMTADEEKLARSATLVLARNLKNKSQEETTVKQTKRKEKEDQDDEQAAKVLATMLNKQ